MVRSGSFPYDGILRRLDDRSQMEVRLLRLPHAVRSRNTTTTPIMSPALLRIGAELSPTAVNLPSLDLSTVLVARRPVLPSRKTTEAGSSMAAPVYWLERAKTVVSGWPSASSPAQPEIRCAAGFRNVMIPFASVAITASPIPPKWCKEVVKFYRLPLDRPQLVDQMLLPGGGPCHNNAGR